MSSARRTRSPTRPRATRVVVAAAATTAAAASSLRGLVRSHAAPRSLTQGAGTRCAWILLLFCGPTPCTCSLIGLSQALFSPCKGTHLPLRTLIAPSGLCGSTLHPALSVWRARGTRGAGRAMGATFKRPVGIRAAFGGQVRASHAAPLTRALRHATLRAARRTLSARPPAAAARCPTPRAGRREPTATRPRDATALGGGEVKHALSAGVGDVARLAAQEARAAAGEGCDAAAARGQGQRSPRQGPGAARMGTACSCWLAMHGAQG